MAAPQGGGWGRRAKAKPGGKLEDDELFKAIGGQLESSNIDYSQWQNQRKVQTTTKPPPPQPKRESVHLGPDRPLTGVTVSSGARSSMSNRSCQHRKVRAIRDDLKLPNITDKDKLERLRILQLRIRTRRQTMNEYKKRQQELLVENMKLQKEIDQDEGASHDEVKKLLRKYEKFRGGISTLNDKFMKELSDTRQDLEETEHRINADISGLQSQVNQMDARLQEKQSELNVLMNYKDKEYPVKALRISDLHKEIENLKITHEEDENELQHIVETEVDKFRKEQNKVKKNITEKVTEVSIQEMHPSLKDTALQNMVMQKELEFHKKELEELEEQVSTLSEKVKSLKRDPKTSIRMQMFPEFFPNREKCTPDMEVVLDIPTQEWLPI